MKKLLELGLLLAPAILIPLKVMEVQLAILQIQLKLVELNSQTPSIMRELINLKEINKLGFLLLNDMKDLKIMILIRKNRLKKDQSHPFSDD